MRNSKAFTLIELLVVLFIIALLVALLLPAVQSSKTPARRSVCISNLKNIGIALQIYSDQERWFPPGGMTSEGDPTKTTHSVNALLLPFFEEEALKYVYDRSQDWRRQNSLVAQCIVPVFNCPSADGENPFVDRLRNELMQSSGISVLFESDQPFATTNYVFCKGVTDAWCRVINATADAFAVPSSERGMFDMDWSIRLRDVTDGTSKTIAAAEGADGMAWHLSSRSAGSLQRDMPAPSDRFGISRRPYQAWIAMEPSDAAASTEGLVVGSIFACTLEPMNKNPVTDSWADTSALNDCRQSLPSAPGTMQQSASGGPHTTPNFRSDHPGGGNFLFADGSVHFLEESIDMLLYKRLSTPRGQEDADLPGN
jgi:prepilin-type N-terminal cleavage/methylation domain-containing protein/prepilin-type processing-associated H-X9-DG protein